MSPTIPRERGHAEGSLDPEPDGDAAMRMLRVAMSAARNGGEDLPRATDELQLHGPERARVSNVLGMSGGPCRAG